MWVKLKKEEIPHLKIGDRISYSTPGNEEEYVFIILEPMFFNSPSMEYFGHDRNRGQFSFTPRSGDGSLCWYVNRKKRLPRNYIRKDIS